MVRDGKIMSSLTLREPQARMPRFLVLAATVARARDGRWVLFARLSQGDADGRCPKDG